jgi:hypothetical protein
MDPVTICNMALGLFGGNRIASIEEDQLDTDEATLCNTFYLPSVMAALEDGAWLFATDFIDLGGAADSPYQTLPAAPPGNVPFGLTTGGVGVNSIVRPLVSQFKLPDTVVRVIACDDGGGSFSIEWEKNGRLIRSEQASQLLAKVIMTKLSDGTDLINDLNKWPPSFAWAVAYKLASVICGPITQSGKLEEKMIQLYEGHLKRAMSLDGMQGATTQTIRMRSESIANRRF